MSDAAPAAPTFSAPAALRDGSRVLLRAVRPDDKPLFVDAFHRLSPQTIRQRFFEDKKELTREELTYLTEVDFRNHVALVALLPDPSGERLIGVARFIRLPEKADTAEAAFVVADEHQGKGVGTLLFSHLLPFARHLGVTTLQGVVQPQNRHLLQIFESSGLPIESSFKDGLLYVQLSLDAPMPRPGPD